MFSYSLHYYHHELPSKYKLEYVADDPKAIHEILTNMDNLPKDLINIIVSYFNLPRYCFSVQLFNGKIKYRNFIYDKPFNICVNTGDYVQIKDYCWIPETRYYYKLLHEVKTQNDIKKTC